MAKYVIEETTLTNTANAIREKTGKTDAITPTNFATEIASIQGGGGSANEYFDLVVESGTQIYRTSIKALPVVDFKDKTSMSYAFDNLRAMTKIDGIINTEKVTNISNAFNSCNSLLEIPQFDTSNVTNFFYAFYGTNDLVSLPAFECGKAENINYMISSITNQNDLKNVGGFINLGQAYSVDVSANYSNYTLALSARQKLTHDSAMNIINGLYDIASKGVAMQKVIFSSQTLALLTEDEIAIATNKGWTIS